MPFWAVGAGVGALPSILPPAVVVEGAVPDEAVVVAGAVLVVVVADGAEVPERLGNKPEVLAPAAGAAAVVAGVPLPKSDFVGAGAAAVVVDGVAPPKSGLDVAGVPVDWAVDTPPNRLGVDDVAGAGAGVLLAGAVVAVGLAPNRVLAGVEDAWDGCEAGVLPPPKRLVELLAVGLVNKLEPVDAPPPNKFDVCPTDGVVPPAAPPNKLLEAPVEGCVEVRAVLEGAGLAVDPNKDGVAGLESP